jgi:hypothetical protein
MAALNLVSDTIPLFNGYQTAHEPPLDQADDPRTVHCEGRGLYVLRRVPEIGSGYGKILDTVYDDLIDTLRGATEVIGAGLAP